MTGRDTRNVLPTLVAICVGGSLLVACLWAFLYFGLYLGLGNLRVRGHQEFAANGVDQIAPASQMAERFEDCRHSISYGSHAGRESVSIWNSVAFFGGRYELTMQVPVAIESSRRGRPIGDPSFLLLEVESVEDYGNGQVGASIGRNFRFGPDEWRRVYEAGGDFGAVGFEVKTGPPVAGFEGYAAAHRR